MQRAIGLATLSLLLGCAGGGSGDPSIDAGGDGSVTPGSCGDGVVDDGEACDDGNSADDDACVACAWARCGDGAVRAGVEDCDDDSATCVGCLTCDGAGDAETGHCFTRVDGALTRAAAYDACAARGAHLASIDRPAAWAAVAPLWIDPYPSHWIGLVRAADGQNLWRWEPGAMLGEARWNPGEPNDAGGIEDCVEAYGADGLWNDLACDQGRPALCERPTWSIDPATGHAYRVFYRLRTHPEAIADCAAAGARLVSITSAEEQAFLVALTPLSVWIGAFQGATENGGWYWASAEPFAFTAWFDGQPDDYNAAEDCAHTIANDGRWNDLGCTARLPYVCEIE